MEKSNINQQTKENMEIIELLEEIFREEPIYKEKDSEVGRIIYMPQSIKRLIEVPVVNRMNRILQTGTNIYDDIKMLGSRMQHSKGTYSLMLELLVNLWERDPEFKQRIKEKKQEKYIKAILAKEILHDVGHGPFSHTLETACNLQKGFHENIGERLIKENPELNRALNDIEPGLPELIEELKEKDILGMNRLCEGQFDVDRADFLVRDNYFIGNNYKSTSNLVQQLLKGIKMKAIRQGGSEETQIIPVFDHSQMPNIEEFLSERFYNYDKVYKNNHKYMYEQIFKAFAIRLMESSEKYKLKEYLENIMNKQGEDIDLEEYVSYDDIEYMKGIVEVVKNTKDENLQALGVMSLPTINMVPGIYYGMMINSNKRVSMEEQLSETDEQLIRDMKKIEEIRKEKSITGNFVQENCLLVDSEQKSVIIYFMDRMQGLVKYNLADSMIRGIKTWTNNISYYDNKLNEEIYVEAQDGNYYEYSVHPERTNERQRKTKLGMCVMIPELRMDECEEEKASKIIHEVQEFNERISQDMSEDR